LVENWSQIERIGNWSKIGPKARTPMYTIFHVARGRMSPGVLSLFSAALCLGASLDQVGIENDISNFFGVLPLHTGLCIKGNVPGGKTATHFLSRRVARNGKKFLFSAALCCSLLLFPVLCCSFPFSGSEFTIGFVQTRGRRKTSKSKKVCMKGNVPGGTKAMCQGAKQQHTFFPVCCSLLLSAVL
jgi:hypothetical protein